MKRIDKTKLITISIAALLVLILAVVLIAGSCSRRENSDWSPISSQGTKNTTGEDTTEGNTPENAEGTQDQGTDNKPQINVDVVDRDQVDNAIKGETKPEIQEGNSTPTTAPTEPTGTTGSTETPETTQPATGEKKVLTYEEFNALDMEGQKAYRDTFESLHAFLEWYTAAEKAYREKNITDGTVNPRG